MAEKPVHRLPQHGGHHSRRRVLANVFALQGPVLPLHTCLFYRGLCCPFTRVCSTGACAAPPHVFALHGPELPLHTCLFYRGLFCSSTRVCSTWACAAPAHVFALHGPVLPLHTCLLYMGLSCPCPGRRFNLIVDLAANQTVDAVSLQRFAAGPPAATDAPPSSKGLFAAFMRPSVMKKDETWRPCGPRRLHAALGYEAGLDIASLRPSPPPCGPRHLHAALGYEAGRDMASLRPSPPSCGPRL